MIGGGDIFNMKVDKYTEPVLLSDNIKIWLAKWNKFGTPKIVDITKLVAEVCDQDFKHQISKLYTYIEVIKESKINSSKDTNPFTDVVDFVCKTFNEYLNDQSLIKKLVGFTFVGDTNDIVCKLLGVELMWFGEWSGINMMSCLNQTFSNITPKQISASKKLANRIITNMKKRSDKIRELIKVSGPITKVFYPSNIWIWSASFKLIKSLFNKDKDGIFFINDYLQAIYAKQQNGEFIEISEHNIKQIKNKNFETYNRYTLKNIINDDTNYKYCVKNDFLKVFLKKVSTRINDYKEVWDIDDIYCHYDAEFLQHLIIRLNEASKLRKLKAC